MRAVGSIYTRWYAAQVAGAGRQAREQRNQETDVRAEARLRLPRQQDELSDTDRREEQTIVKAGPGIGTRHDELFVGKSLR